MTLSTRFPVAIHILTLLALKPTEFFKSEMIAKSVGTNAVVIRRILPFLQEAGFIVTQAGIQGGAKLNVDPQKLTLLDIYEVVEEKDVFKMHEAHPECPVACSVISDVEKLMLNAEEKMKLELKKTKLSQVSQPAIEAFKNWTQ